MNEWQEEEVAHRRRAAKLVEAAGNVALVAREHHRDVRLLMRCGCQSRHFALLPVHYLVAARNGLTATDEVQRLAKLIAARKRRLQTRVWHPKQRSRERITWRLLSAMADVLGHMTSFKGEGQRGGVCVIDIFEQRHHFILRKAEITKQIRRLLDENMIQAEVL